MAKPAEKKTQPESKRAIPPPAPPPKPFTFKFNAEKRVLHAYLRNGKTVTFRDAAFDAVRLADDTEKAIAEVLKKAGHLK